MSRSRTITEAPVREEASSSRQTQYDDQIREYRSTQRKLYNIQQKILKLKGRITRRPYQRTLEQEVRPEETLKLSMRRRARLVPAEVLYHDREDTTHHRVYHHRSEESIICLPQDQIDRSFIQPESADQLTRSGYSFIHIGIMQVRIQILHRQEEGTMAMIVFRDTRWEGDRSWRLI